MRSTDPDERLRGIERAAATHTSDSLTLLERAARSNGPGGLDPRMPDEGIARKDPRALLAVVRALAGWLDDDGARVALAEVVRAPNEALATRRQSVIVRDPAAEDVEGAARVTLARQEAAIALAESAVPAALEQLVAAARSGGAAQEAALVGLGVHPPSDPLVLGGVALTTAATIALAVRVGDLRALDPILGAVRASDPSLRAAAMSALGVAGDTRGIEVARAALHDGDPRVRVAAAGALASLAAPDAPEAVEALIGDDATALEGLRVARRLQGEGLTRAAAARAVATADPTTRSEAIAVLGRQTDASAARALAAFLSSPLLQSDAAGALAQSPCPDALGAIEALARAAADPVNARLAARAYFVRALTRGDRSRPLDALLVSLAASNDPRDRAVATQARVALGRSSLEAALSDADPRVRRAGAMGAVGHRDERTAEVLVARAAIEPDEATRHLLALGWLDDRAAGRVPTSVLVERATAGGPDAPLAALALARRSDEALAPRIDALLTSHDPLLRAHAARGLGLARAPDAAGRLSRAYEREGDAVVRRAIVDALSMLVATDGEATRDRALALAARLDPDPVARWTAATALARGAARSDAPRKGAVEEVAWIRLVPAEGAALEHDPSALLAPNSGIALPIVFDDEGYALVPGVSPGEARLRLAPGLPSYTPPAP
jgi:HEAT repeat protein